MTMTGTMRALDATRGAIRVEDVYDTDVEDLWDACTTPARLGRWIAEVSGDLRVGGVVHTVFTSTATGSMTVEICDRPEHLLLTGGPGIDDDTQLEAWLTPEGSGTRLVVEERGLPLDKLHYYGAGWQAHLEDLAAELATGGPVHVDGWSPEASAPRWQARWEALTPAYEAMAVDRHETASA